MSPAVKKLPWKDFIFSWAHSTVQQVHLLLEWIVKLKIKSSNKDNYPVRTQIPIELLVAAVKNGCLLSGLAGSV